VYEFRREIVIGGESARTGKIVAEKVIRYFEEKLRAKVCPRRLPAARVLSSNPPGYPRWRRSPRSLRQPTVSCTRCCG
jgi:hypothetical protein